MFILPRPSRAGAAREGEGEQVSLTDEIDRHGANYLSHEEVRRVVAVLRAAEAVCDADVPGDDPAWMTFFEAKTALRRALEDCDEA